MAIPTPSFFKIRLVVIFLIFLAFCFFVGFIKNVFAYTWADSPCKQVLYVYAGSQVRSWGYDGWSLDSAGKVVPGEVLYFHPCDAYSCPDIDRVAIYPTYWTGTRYVSTQVYASYFYNFGEGTKITDINEWRANTECKDCTEQEQQLIEQCGANNWEWTDKDQCLGQCTCNASSPDSDGDGTPDCKDKCPTDPNKTEYGECGCLKPDIYNEETKTFDCMRDEGLGKPSCP